MEALKPMNQYTHRQQELMALARLPYVAAIKERDARIAELEALLTRFVERADKLNGIDTGPAGEARAALAKS